MYIFFFSCRCLSTLVAMATLNVHSVVTFAFSGPSGSTRLFESRVALNPGLGGVRDVICHYLS